MLCVVCRWVWVLGEWVAALIETLLYIYVVDGCAWGKKRLGVWMIMYKLQVGACVVL